MAIVGVSRVGGSKRATDREMTLEGIVNVKYVVKCKKSTCILLGARTCVVYDDCAWIM